MNLRDDLVHNKGGSHNESSGFGKISLKAFQTVDVLLGVCIVDKTS